MEKQPWFAFLATLRQTVTSGAHWSRPWVELLPHIVRAFGAGCWPWSAAPLLMTWTW